MLQNNNNMNLNNSDMFQNNNNRNLSNSNMLQNNNNMNLNNSDMFQNNNNRNLSNSNMLQNNNNMNLNNSNMFQNDNNRNLSNSNMLQNNNNMYQNMYQNNINNNQNNFNMCQNNINSNFNTCQNNSNNYNQNQNNSNRNNNYNQNISNHNYLSDNIDQINSSGNHNNYNQIQNNSNGYSNNINGYQNRPFSQGYNNQNNNNNYNNFKRQLDINKMYYKRENGLENGISNNQNQKSQQNNNINYNNQQIQNQNQNQINNENQFIQNGNGREENVDNGANNNNDNNNENGKPKPEVKKEKTNTELILDYENDIRKEIEKTTPLISEDFHISKLVEEYSSNEEYSNSINNIAKKYKYIRKVRRDGNCFYRSFIFRLFEHICIRQDITLFEKIKKKIKGAKEITEKNGYDWAVVEDFYNLFLKEFKSCFNSLTYESTVRDYLDTLFCEKDKGNYLIYFIRFCIAAYLKENKETYKVYIEEDFDEWIRKEVEPIDHTADQLQIMACVNYFDVGVKIEYLNKNQSEVVKLPHDKPDNEFFIFLLYSPGHYDILYP